MFKVKNPKHLKPLSKYAQRVFNDPVALTSIYHYIKPAYDLKNATTKRATNDCDRTTTAWSKRPTSSQTPCSPDVGCLVESPSLRMDLAAGEGRRSVGSVIDHLHSPHSLMCRAHNVAQSFDLDVDDLLNLSPCGDRSQRVPDCEKKRELDIGSASLHRSKYGQRSAAPVGDKGLNLTTITQDGSYGYCCTEDQTKPRNVSVSLNQQHLDCRGVKEECLSESCQVAGTEPRQHSSVLDLKIIVSGGPSSVLMTSPTRGSVDDLWRVGLPMLSEDTMESPLQVKASKPRKDHQLCAFCYICSQTTC